EVAVTADAHVHAFRQCVDNGDTDTVEATGDRIPAAAELTASVQDRHNHFNGGFIFGGVHGHGNTATVVLNAHAAIFLEGHVDGVGVAGQGLIHRVIHHLIDEVMQAAFRSGADRSEERRVGKESGEQSVAVEERRKVRVKNDRA